MSRRETAGCAGGRGARSAAVYLTAVASVVLVACGGARAPVSPHAPQMSAPVDVHRLSILVKPPPPQVLAPFSVNPTFAVSARPGIIVAPVADGVAFQGALDRLEAGTLPAPRPEVFVDAVADDGPGPLLRAEWAPSPYRPGYHGLRLVIAPPPAPAPPAVVIVLEARRELLGDPDRAALRALAAATGSQRLGVLVAGESPRWQVELAPQVRRRWAAAIDGLDLAGPSDLAAAVALARASLPTDGVVVVVASPQRGAPDGPAAVVRVAPGADLVRALPAALARRSGFAEARLGIDFDDRHVERYRLVGFDGGGPGGRAPVLWSGRPTAVLIEIKLRPQRPAGALGRVHLRGLGPDGRSVVHGAAIAPLDAPERVGVALLAAAVAEKLREAWWARGMDWARLAADAERLKAQPGARLMARVIERAAALDRRPDRFAEHGPPDAMDPDAVPILRGGR